MKHINQRNIKIIDELMSFCYKYGATNLEMELNTTKNEITILIRANINNISQKTLRLAEDLLKIPRCHEMEEYYWNLTGDDDTDTELTLVGMMTDDAQIDYNNKILEIKLKRLK